MILAERSYRGTMAKSKETQLLEGLNDNVGKNPVDEEDNDEREQLSELENSHAKPVEAVDNVEDEEIAHLEHSLAKLPLSMAKFSSMTRSLFGVNQVR